MLKGCFGSGVLWNYWTLVREPNVFPRTMDDLARARLHYEEPEAVGAEAPGCPRRSYFRVLHTPPSLKLRLAVTRVPYN